MSGLLLFFLGNHEYVGYSYSFFPRRSVGIDYCNVTPLFTGFYLFRV